MQEQLKQMAYDFEQWRQSKKHGKPAKTKGKGTHFNLQKNVCIG